MRLSLIGLKLSMFVAFALVMTPARGGEPPDADPHVRRPVDLVDVGAWLILRGRDRAC